MTDRLIVDSSTKLSPIELLADYSFT